MMSEHEMIFRDNELAALYVARARERCVELDATHRHQIIVATSRWCAVARRSPQLLARLARAVARGGDPTPVEEALRVTPRRGALLLEVYESGGVCVSAPGGRVAVTISPTQTDPSVQRLGAELN